MTVYHQSMLPLSTLNNLCERGVEEQERVGEKEESRGKRRMKFWNACLANYI